MRVRTCDHNDPSILTLVYCRCHTPNRTALKCNKCNYTFTRDNDVHKDLIDAVRHQDQENKSKILQCDHDFVYGIAPANNGIFPATCKKCNKNYWRNRFSGELFTK